MNPPQGPVHLQQFPYRQITPSHPPARLESGATSPTPPSTPVAQQQPARAMQEAPSTVPSLHTSAMSYGPSPPAHTQDGRRADRERTNTNNKGGNTILHTSTGHHTTTATAASATTTRGGSSIIAPPSISAGGAAVAALAPVMGHLYGNSNNSSSSGHPAASVESSPYSYLSHITPILQREVAEGSRLTHQHRHSLGDEGGLRHSFSPAAVRADRHRQATQPPRQQSTAGINNSRIDALHDAPDRAGDNAMPEREGEEEGTPRRAEDAAVAAAMDTARRVYNEKLRGSVAGIMEALASELPQDHIFLQLMADPATEQYGKVRLSEIVEGFLYATQAQQYHNLAAELARRVVDNVALTARVAELQRMLEEKSVMEKGTPPPGAAALQGRETHLHFDKFTETEPTRSGGGRVDAATTTATAAADNPMSEEAARRELMAILEATSREHELERCRRALVAPAKLAEVAHTEPNYTEKHSYIADVVNELYRAVHAFMRYADGSLESLETLRNDLAVADSGGGGGGRGSVHNSPQRPDAWSTPSGNSNGIAHHGALSAFPTPSLPERARLEELAEQLRDAQVLTARTLDRLQHKAQEQDRHAAQLTRELEEARAKGSTEAAAATTEAREMQREMEEMMQEHERALALQREETRRQHDELQARLRTLQQQRDEAQRHHSAANAQVEALQAELHQLRVKDTQRQHEASATSAALRDELHRCRADLRAAEGELVCAQVEVCMSGLEALYHESEVAKRDLMQQQSGQDAVARALVSTARDTQEQLRHTRAQLDLAEAAALDQKVALRGAMEELGVLLRAMWEDESVAAALQLVAEGTGGSAVDRWSSAEAGMSCEERPSQGGGAAGLNESNITTTTSATTASATATAAATPWRHAQDVHKLPTTLAGMSTALAYAYRDHKGRMGAWCSALDRAKAGFAQRDDRIRALEAAEAELKALLEAERDQAHRLRAELDAVTDTSPMRELLARQDALLSAVSEERNELRKQWNSLNADYITLERRNGQLHERCTAKEHANAKLSSLLRHGRGAAGGGGRESAHVGTDESPLTDFHTPSPSRTTTSGGDGGFSALASSPSSPPSAQRQWWHRGEDESGRHHHHRHWFLDSIGSTPESGMQRAHAQTPVTIDTQRSPIAEEAVVGDASDHFDPRIVDA